MGRNHNFENIKVNDEWCFKNARSVEQFTHGYHRYPAKFLPNLVRKLIEEQTKYGDIVADLFAGCGTTLVEAKIHGRESVGVDINPVARLIAEVKTTPIPPELLFTEFVNIIGGIDDYDSTKYDKMSKHERLDYWFVPENKKKIAFLYERISSVKNEDIKNFFLVSLSHILKNCSRWLQSGTKPQIDPNKKTEDPFDSFKKHTKKMLKKNEEFHNYLSENGYIDRNCKINLEDARNTSIISDSIGAIITSPPYVTSYEYADIHQLTSYWYDYIDDLYKFRKKFIGTFYSKNQSTDCVSYKAQEIVDKLLKIDDRTAKEVANYFNDMNLVGEEMYRIVKKGGIVCVVIGNTSLKNVRIESAEVFFDILLSLGFKKVDVVKRSIPNKLMPTIRDKNTGRFTKLDNKNHKLIYPEEYILIVKKV